MDDETRARMLGQTAGQLVGVLAALRKQAAPKPWSKWNDMAPGVVASGGWELGRTEGQGQRGFTESPISS